MKQIKTAEDYFKTIVERTIKDVEATIGRPMSKSQRRGLWNAGSLMFLEAMTNDFYFHRDDMVKVEEWLKEIDGFERKNR